MSETICFVIGYILGAVFVAFLVSDEVKEAKEVYQLLAECEVSLPRDQHCKLVAVREEE